MSSVCMISSLHGLYDDRIYWKEALSLKNHGYDVIHITTGDTDLDFVSEHGIRLIQVKKNKYFSNPYVDILFRKITFRPDVYKKILRICTFLRADVYHYHDIQINRISKDLKRLAHAPALIYDVHEDFSDLVLTSNSLNKRLRWFFKLYAKWLNRWELSHASSCDFIIVAVDHIYQKFKTMASQGKAAVIYNYTTLFPETVHPAEKKNYDAIYCGQINPLRGAMEIAQAVVIARETIPGIKVLLLGPVPDMQFKRQLLDVIGKNNLRENLILYGNVPYNEIEDFYQDSRVGLGIFMPVSIFYYGIQIKTFEYMAFGLPVICSNFGTIDQIIRETGSGITVDPLSPVAISNALITLLTEKKLYDTCSANGRLAVKNKYNWKTEEARLLGIYKELSRLHGNA
jgi:glycosyltransferase involved in cell wall biosynthesis